MRFSKSYIKTLKEIPKEAEIQSHILMLRAGMIKKLASGIYSYLPLAKKVLNKIENIVKEEMDKNGAQEVLLPVMQPAEIWKETGRFDTFEDLMVKLKDRNKRDFVLGPTHEEAITDIVRNDISSYKSLPFNLYQIQTKFRDEKRPRFGLMRGREFIMKDAYSFHATSSSLDEEFNNMHDVYVNIFTRLGLNFRYVEADSGVIGGSGSQEFHVLADSGEDEIIFCNNCDYAANVEAAKSITVKTDKEDLKEPILKETPNSTTVQDVSNFLNVKLSNIVKSIIYKDLRNDNLYLALIRGDLEINEVKLKNQINALEIVMLSDEEFEKYSIPKGFIGPYNQNFENITIVADNSVLDVFNQVVGGNKKDFHYLNINYGRDYKADIIADIKLVRENDSCCLCKGDLKVARGIETGHIFKLGDKYSKAMKATFLDENGTSKNMIMGCYGLGVSRTMAAAIEQNCDDFGIIWSSKLAPYVVDVIPANIKDATQVKLAESLYKKFQQENIEVILDDRDERAGFKMKDADLIGFPFKIICGKKAPENIVELKIRKTGEVIELDSESVISKIKELMIIY